jgi:hypothetical protein
MPEARLDAAYVARLETLLEQQGEELAQLKTQVARLEQLAIAQDELERLEEEQARAQERPKADSTKPFLN